MEGSKFTLLFFYVFYLAIFPTVMANIDHFDHVWHRRLVEARKAAKEAYKPNPMKVTADFNTHVISG
ncbi:putative pectate lyase P59, partial [Mucuna pruriens]